MLTIQEIPTDIFSEIFKNHPEQALMLALSYEEVAERFVESQVQFTGTIDYYRYKAIKNPLFRAALEETATIRRQLPPGAYHAFAGYVTSAEPTDSADLIGIKSLILVDPSLNNFNPIENVDTLRRLVVEKKIDTSDIQVRMDFEVDNCVNLKEIICDKNRIINVSGIDNAIIRNCALVRVCSLCEHMTFYNCVRVVARHCQVVTVIMEKSPMASSVEVLVEGGKLEFICNTSKDVNNFDIKLKGTPDEVVYIKDGIEVTATKLRGNVRGYTRYRI